MPIEDLEPLENDEARATRPVGARPRDLALSFLVGAAPFAIALVFIAAIGLDKKASKVAKQDEPVVVPSPPARSDVPFLAQCPWCRRIIKVSPPVNGSLPIGDKPPDAFPTNKPASASHVE